MPKITVTDLSDESREIDAESGISLMEAIRDNDFDDLAAICGGACSCCTCHVYIEPAFADKVGTMEEDERDLIEDRDCYKEGESRLSCQIEVTDELNGLNVTIAPEV